MIDREPSEDLIKPGHDAFLFFKSCLFFRNAGVRLLKNIFCHFLAFGLLDEERVKPRAGLEQRLQQGSGPRRTRRDH